MNREIKEGDVEKRMRSGWERNHKEGQRKNWRNSMGWGESRVNKQINNLKKWRRFSRGVNSSVELVLCTTAGLVHRLRERQRNVQEKTEKDVPGLIYR